jgi:hypothetical protein
METDTTFTHYRDGLRVTWRPRTWHGPGTSREMLAKPRVYVPHEMVSEPQPTEPLCSDVNCESGYCSLYRKTDGERGLLEVDHRVWAAYLRRCHVEVYTRLRPLLAEFFPNVVSDPNTIKLHFSAKAGCSCGCSPGYILDKPHIGRGDFWVKIATQVAPTVPTANLAYNLAVAAGVQHKLVRV